MMMELQRIEETFERGIALIEDGKVRAAERLTAHLKDSWAVSEATRARAILRGYCFLMRGKTRKAKGYCLERICYLWGNPDGLFLIRQPHPCPTPQSRFFEIEIKGGRATLGVFTRFSSEHRVRFGVVADDEFEAVSFIDEIANFQDPSSKELLLLDVTPLDEHNDICKKGVYSCSPFWLEEEDSPEIFE